MRQTRKRSKLSKKSISGFSKWTARITQKPLKDQKSEAKTLWEQCSRNRPIKEARQKLERMARGLARCMYCEDNRGSDIDHFYPKSLYPAKTFSWGNFVLACGTCNSGQRSAIFPLDAQQQPLLIDPTKEDPGLHLLLTPSTGQFRATQNSAKGTPTIDAFGLNIRSELVSGRRNAWLTVQSLISEYAQAKQSGNKSRSDGLRRALCGHPFSTVLSYVIKPKHRRSLSQSCLAALQSCPEITTWLT